MLGKLFLILSCTVCIIAAVDPQVYTFKSIDGLDLKISVYVPKATPSSGKYPILFSTHGGGYIAGSRDTAWTPRELEEILNRGWVAVTMDYRLQPVVLLDELYQDVQDAYQWVLTELPKILPVDLDRIAAFGGSAGGGLALINGYKLNPRPKVVIALYPYCANFNDAKIYQPDTPVTATLAAMAEGITDNVLEHTFGTRADARYKLWMNALNTAKVGWLFASHNPEEPVENVIAKLKEFSATENVDENYPPTYLAHGLNPKREVQKTFIFIVENLPSLRVKDYIVSYNQSVQMAEKLQEKGVKYVLDLVPSVGHTFDSHNSESIWQEHVLPAFDFAQQYLKDAEVQVEKTFLAAQ